MKKYKKYRDVIIARFKANPQEAQAYLKNALEEFEETKDSEQLLLALNTVNTALLTEGDNIDKLIGGRKLDDWDRQIVRDAASGKFDKLIEEVLAEHKAGKTTKLCNGLEDSKPLE